MAGDDSALIGARGGKIACYVGISREPQPRPPTIMTLYPFMFVLVISPALVLALLAGGALAVVAATGAATALLCGALEITTLSYLKAVGWAATPQFQSLVLFGGIEEPAKFLVVFLFRNRFASKPALMQGAVACAIGFACAENLLYLIGFAHDLPADRLPSAILVRMLLPFGMHVAAAPILVSGLCVAGVRPIGGIVLASFLHGLYDAAQLFPAQAAGPLMFLVLAITAWGAGLAYRYSTELN